MFTPPLFFRGGGGWSRTSIIEGNGVCKLSGNCPPPRHRMNSPAGLKQSTDVITIIQWYSFGDWRRYPHPIPVFRILKIIQVPELNPNFNYYIIQCSRIVRLTFTQHPQRHPSSSSLGSPYRARPFAYVNLATNYPSQVLPATNNQLLGEDEPFGTSYIRLEVTFTHATCKSTDSKVN